ncbi:Ribosomal protein L12 [Prunus dulcis]|uniref:Ribosomal protein L12 n=1 Tax=Prunus dulcis TaxID=3755 RepID=A0A4Y1QRF4_PRUDU|nr:Ribosomal protein L12 [Prunus dulcis]
MIIFDYKKLLSNKIESNFRYLEEVGRFGIVMCNARDRHPLCKGPCTNLGIPMAVSATGPGKGGGLLERPVIEKTTPARDSEFDLRKSRKTAPPYRVILHNDNYNKGNTLCKY